MYALNIIEEESLLELIVHANLNEEEFRVLLEDIKHTRRKFTDGYKLLIVFPPKKLRLANIDEDEKIDLSIFTARIKGLKQVVLQTPYKDSETVKRLRDLYLGLSVNVSITHNSYESQKRLGINI